MPNSITANGLTTATQAEILAFYTAALQSIYGADINLESDTPDGQEINLFIQSVLDLEDLLTSVYNSFNPDNAIGNVLDQRVAINGIQRQAGTFTITNITITVSQSVNLYGLDQTLQPVYTVADAAGNQWQLVTTSLGVTIGSHVFVFQAANPGQVLTVPNTITIPVTIVLGVTSINNPTTYTVLGINEESDAALKIRRQKSVSLRSQGYFQGLLAALENINGITSALIFENTTGATDINGVPGHSIWVIVAGVPNVPLSVPYSSTTVYAYGNIASSGGLNYISVANGNVGNLVSNPAFWQIYNPIAEAIYNYRNAGAGMYITGGSGSNTFPITQIDGTIFNVYWDNVVAENLIIKFQANSLDGIHPPNIVAIQTYLVANFKPGVNQEVNVNALSTEIQIADPNTMALFPSNFGFARSDVSPFSPSLSNTYKNNQWSFVGGVINIIALPIILACPNGVQVIVSGLVTNTTVSTPHGGSTIQFSTIGGDQSVAVVYSLFSGAGSINSSSGLYTSAGAGTDVVHVTDTLGNVGIATITVT